MECLAVMAVSVGVIFVRLAMMQDLNPILWGGLAVGIYVGAPILVISRGATWYQLPWVWASSFIGLFVLFIVQSVVAERKRRAARGGPAKTSKKKRKSGKPRGD